MTSGDFLKNLLEGTQPGAGYKLATDGKSRKEVTDGAKQVFGYLKEHPGDLIPKGSGLGLLF